MSPGASPVRAGHISILIPTKARIEMLAQVFRSLQAHTARKDQVSLWFYLDQDDAITRQAVAENYFPETGLAVHWHIGAQTATMGEAFHTLWNLSGSNSEIYMLTCDDACFDTPGWDDIVRTAAAKFPDGIFLAAPFDPATSDTCTYPIFGWRWLATLGQIFPGYFPFWYDDRWVHQIGDMAGRYVHLPMVMQPIRGKGRTRRMRDVPFWARFFQLALDERKDSAKQLIDAMNPDPEKKPAALQHLEQRAAELEKQQDHFSDLYAVFQEERFTLHTPEERRAFNPGYFQKEAAAVARLVESAQQRIAAGKHDAALKFLDATLMSNLRVRQVQDLKVSCLRALGRHAEADKLAQETLAAWPEMNSARRLFRFLGMVATEGKTMMVGFLSGGGKKK